MNEEEVVYMLRSAVNNKNEFKELVNYDTLVERLKRLRALNREPDRIGLTEYTWRSFSIDTFDGAKLRFSGRSQSAAQYQPRASLVLQTGARRGVDKIKNR